MTLWYDDGQARFHLGDCREVMAEMPDSLFDAVVTDPPYGLGFMARDWDHAVPGPAFWAEMLRVAKPGAHLVAFGGTRKFHRLAVAIEDAGWELRDTLCWLYGSGFPKSLDVSKAIDKAAGVEREIVGPSRRHAGISSVDGANPNLARHTGPDVLTAPATDLARQWEGWGTALKPAWEPIILARKPLAGTVAANVTTHGTGGLNIDGCRVGVGEHVPGGGQSRRGFGGVFGDGEAPNGADSHTLGRWPANLVLDEEAAAMLDEQAGDVKGAASNGTRMGNGYRGGFGPMVQESSYGDSGGPSRFFYTSKSSRAEREQGLDAPPGKRANSHPTVKPLDLMRWLCRLVTPAGGLILDPFIGSGTTAIAAKAEGFRIVGIDLNPEYLEIAQRRCAQMGLFAGAAL